MPNAPPQPVAAPARHPASAPAPRDADAAPSFDALLRHIRQEVARVFQLPPDSRAKEDQAILSLAHRAFARYGAADKAALPPPLKQVDAYLKGPNQNESLSHYLYARRADLALDDIDSSDGDDKDGVGEPSPDDDRDSDEDAIGSEHPKSPSLGPTASLAGTAGNTTVSSPEPRSTVSAPAQQKADQKKSASASASASAANGVDHTFTGDDRCTNCIMRNNPTCIVNSSRQRCDSCFMKRHRCSKVLTPPTRPSRETKSASVKGKGPGDAPADANGDSASARAPKRKRTAIEEDTKRNESAAKRPARPQRPAAAAASSAAGTSASASAPVQRPPAPKKPPMQNGNAAASSSNAQNLSLAALAASASRAARAPTNTVPAHNSRHQYYQEKLQVISGILGMVQTAVKELQDQVNADAAAGR
ncbi:hypothetical protein DICSQDRAFT_177333 [Dichomitus squalens LYAD-421 SS1]|uniref:uncharacterized protein n=1 Tax=Dichomitus squalens (strain LYAD-421) TaxID=732165 RepID=UPI00044118A4|nr:uncharacterized protein DICSQDRAFT_177333 [Dichomitus squalens LYAD-421 SS1]EJF65931.1 hypothetical protein DICSQDRAFT_177333 [Dichomitus squalens LYAD-421 SS1]